MASLSCPLSMGLWLAVLFALGGAAEAAGRQPAEGDSSLLILVDLSGSMAEHPDGGVPRFQALRSETQRALDELATREAERSERCLSVEVWGFYSGQLDGGSWSPERCASEVETGFIRLGAEDSVQTFREALQAQWLPGSAASAGAYLRRREPDGRYDTPLLQALDFGQKRLEQLSGAHRARTLVLVTDGQPECFLSSEDRRTPSRQLGKEKLKERWTQLRQAAWKKWRDAFSVDGEGLQGVVLMPSTENTFLSVGNDRRSSQTCVLQDGGSRCGEKEGEDLASLLWKLARCEVPPPQCRDGESRRKPGGLGVCSEQRQTCVGGRWVDGPLGCELSAAYELEERTCDGLDNDCDGVVDEYPCYPACARETFFKDVVAVGREGRWFCSGTLIHPEVVLTARHCLPADAVLIGDTIERPEAIIPVRAGEAYPDPGVDVALLELQRPVDVLRHAMRGAGVATPPLSVLSHVGYGASNPSGQSGFGAKRELLLDSQGWGCTPERSLREGCDPRHEIRLGGSPGRDTCSGDSGGALFEFLPTSPACVMPSYCEQPDTFPRFGMDRRLLGVTSRSIPGAGVRCGEGGIYTRVDVIRPWIDERLREAQGASEPSTRR